MVRRDPSPVRRRYIPKADGKQRPLGIPTVRDRVVQLVRQWLEAGVMEENGELKETLARRPQSGVISPLLANIYLSYLDRIWAERCSYLGELVRYADDFVAMSATRSQANEALRRIRIVMDRLGLTLHPEKTRMVDLRRGREGFVFLGCTVRKRRSIQRMPNRHFMQRWPSPKATKRIREPVHELTDVRRVGGSDVKQVIGELNPVLRGWGNADRQFNSLDAYVYDRLVRWLRRRGGQRTQVPFEDWPSERFWGLGLHRLRGTVRYPAQATSVRPSLSRAWEMRMHGLKGETGNGRAQKLAPRQ